MELFKPLAVLCMLFAVGTGVIFEHASPVLALFWAFLTGGFLVATAWAVALDIELARREHERELDEERRGRS